MRLLDLYEEYVLYARAANRSKHTIESQHFHLRRFIVFLDEHGYETDTDAITPRILREFISESSTRYSLKTVSNNVRALKTLFAFGIGEELIDSDPTRRVAAPTVPLADYDIFDPADVDVLLRACNKKTLTGIRDFAIIMLLFDSGIRATELITIREDGVDWNRELVAVIGKGAKERLVPVSARTLRTIRRYINKRRTAGFERSEYLFLNQYGEPLTRSGLAQLLRRLGKKTGLHVHPHKFRHSFAVNALRNDAREYDIQDCLGHTTLLMTKRYARQSAVDLARQHKRFSPANSLTARV